MNAEKLERVFPGQALSDVIELILKKIDENKGTQLEGRITTPFESRIAKEKITIADLRRYASLPIECYLVHDEEGNLILSTGSKSSTKYDFGPGIAQLREQEKSIWEHEGYLTGDDLERFMPLIAVKSAEAMKVSHAKSVQSYIAHQHPSRQLKISAGDVMASSRNEADIDMVFTQDGVLFYKVSPGQIGRIRELANDDPDMSDEEFDRAFERFIEEQGLVKKAVMFDTPEMENVVAFMRGEKNWDDIRKF